MVLTVAFNWLEDLEDRLDLETFRTEFGPWEGGSERLEELEKRLRALVLRAGRAYPKRICAYIERLRSRVRLRGRAFGEVLNYAPILAEIGPELLADFVLAETLDELPKDLAAQPIEAGGFYVPRVSHHDWDTFRLSATAERSMWPRPWSSLSLLSSHRPPPRPCNCSSPLQSRHHSVATASRLANRWRGAPHASNVGLSMGRSNFLGRSPCLPVVSGCARPQACRMRAYGAGSVGAE